MREICRFYGIIIKMEYEDNNPPCFHARYSGHKAAIRIKDLVVTGGELPPKALWLVMEWAALHQDQLLTAWDNAKDNKELSKIEPLI